MSSPPPAKAQSDAIDLEVTDLTTIPDREGHYVLSAKLPGGGGLSWRGEVTLQPIASSGEWRLEGFNLATVWQFVQDKVRIAEPKGSLSVDGRYDFRYENATTALSVEDMNARVKGLAITRRDQRPDQRTTLSLQAIEASKVRYDLAKRELVVPRFSFSDGSLSAAAGRDGKIDWAEIFARAEPSKETTPSGAAPSFHARVETTAIERLKLRYIDDTRAKSVEHTGELNAEFGLNLAAGDPAARLSIDRLQASLTNCVSSLWAWSSLLPSEVDKPRRRTNRHGCPDHRARQTHGGRRDDPNHAPWRRPHRVGGRVRTRANEGTPSAQSGIGR